MSARLNHLSLVEYDNYVRHTHRGKAVRDQEGGTTLLKLSQSNKKIIFGLDIEGRRWLVEDD